MTEPRVERLTVRKVLRISEPVLDRECLGCHVGVIFAATSPARCRTLVTLGTPLQAYRAPERVQTLLLLLLYRLLGPVRFVQNGVVDTLLSPRTRAEEPRGGKDGPGVLGACRSGQGEQAVVSISLRRPDLSRFLRRVSSPTQFITGTDHQGWTPVQAEAFSQLLPDGSVAVVPDTAYLTKLEAPAETARLLRQFWAIHATPTQHN